ncbi:MAG TPA: hypothetical protein VGB18_07290, partial [Candidatus Thermoplasmatota archaeon]
MTFKEAMKQLESLGNATSRALTLAILFVHGVAAEDMPPSSFVAYALRDDLTDDETYTVEILIEHVRDRFDPDYWDEWEERCDAREAPGYRPTFA